MALTRSSTSGSASPNRGHDRRCAAGIFVARAVATSFVGCAAAKGLHRSAYYFGGLVGAGVIGVALALVAATLRALHLKERSSETASVDAAAAP